MRKRRLVAALLGVVAGMSLSACSGQEDDVLVDETYTVVQLDRDVSDASNLVAGTNASKLTEAVVRRINEADRQDAGDFVWEKGPEAELILSREDGKEPDLHFRYFLESGDVLFESYWLDTNLNDVLSDLMNSVQK